MVDTTRTNNMEVLDGERCWELVRGARIGRLAATVEGRPQVFPINVMVDDRTVVFRSVPGSKLDAAAMGQPVAVECDDIDLEAGTAWSVVVHGHGFEIDEPQDYLDALAFPLFPWFTAPHARFVRIIPNAVTGRRFQAPDPPSEG